MFVSSCERDACPVPFLEEFPAADVWPPTFGALIVRLGLGAGRPGGWLRVVAVRCAVEGGNHPVAALEDLVGARGVQRLVPLHEGLVSEVKRQIERGQSEDRNLNFEKSMPP